MERLGNPLCIFGSARPEVAFPGATADHQGLHGQETRKSPADAIDRLPHGAGQAFGQILPDEKERLDRSHLLPVILKNDEEIIERLGQRGADQLIKAVVLAFVAEGLTPGRAILQIRQGDDRGKTIRNPDGGAG